jgi:Fe-S oxidoreductase
MAGGIADRALLLEEFIALRLDAGRFELPLAALPAGKALVHGHCHQKAFGTMAPAQRVLGLIPELQVETIASSCCGMAGSFGYQAETADVSKAMAELSLLPKVRKADERTVIVADGTSCRHQIADGARREAFHAVRLLAWSAELAAGEE